MTPLVVSSTLLHGTLHERRHAIKSSEMQERERDVGREGGLRGSGGILALFLFDSLQLP